MIKDLCTLNSISLLDEAFEKLEIYKSLLKKWGKRINITSILKDEEIEKKHFFDSLTGIKAFEKAGINLKGKHIADIGSGGGFPGMVLAVALPETNFTLVEPRHKRCIFLEQVKRTLKLNNVSIECRRIEEVKEKDFDILTMRAVEDPKSAVKITKPFLKNGATLCIYRGKEPFTDEIPGFTIEMINLDLKGVNFKRHFLFIRKEVNVGT
ncbi:16S rRNA (guanine(527)-N(7))-methyltransferase RsmG [Desulfurobacterium indicum]|uniref:Ribosomal RNA small subunit methyltransferase G n=1 Tax=Desulfurobacterium indicum TaxID=1914305 RepID=A0A1R1MMU1_9BACT|nr:16S rRNA (guanine(527)-N(7))-methyltransferase RsmG [Desulfurobacterium indicum]OMH41069.1 16S rRNA (guanine(527)-N(7))-methyltransferase RsmG [Desulfurobacterium indicum]